MKKLSLILAVLLLASCSGMRSTGESSGASSARGTSGANESTQSNPGIPGQPPGIYGGGQ